MKTKILLVDDQVLFVESLKSVFQSRGSDIEVVGTAYNGEEGIRKAEELQPDIILMDVRMPEMDGVQAMEEIRGRMPSVKVVMLTTYDDDAYVKKAIQNGAVGYILKDIPPKELLDIIRVVRNGAFLLSSSVAGKLLKGSSVTDADEIFKEQSLPEWYYMLSRKDRHMLRMVVEGYNNQEIAENVNLANQTVRNYLSEIYGKLDVRGRMEAIKAAWKYIKYL